MTSFSTALRRGASALLGLLTLGLLAYAYVLWWSPEADSGGLNARNAQRVRPGMRWSQARAIMGPAEGTTPSADPGDGRTIYVYSPPPFASDAIYLAVGPDSTVTGISHGD
jgi:hypothetical protein